MKIGFIGLGQMGSGIAGSLLRAGHELTVWNRSRGAVDALVQQGATPANTPEDTLKGDLLVSMLANDAAISEVGLDGALLDRAAKGLIHANCATVSLDMARRMTKAHAARGLGYAACPVFGRPNVAAEGKLLMVAAGAPDTIAALKPLFDAASRRAEVIGTDPVQANLFKIAGNFMIAASIEVMGEAFALLRKGGVDHKKFHEVMSSTLFAAPIFQNYGALIAEEKWEPAGFALKWGLKDVNLARDAGRALSVPLPLAELVRAHFDEAMEKGFAEKDWVSAAAIIAEKAGLPPAH